MIDVKTMFKRQQILADFGEFALRSESLDEILTEACRLVGEALGVERSKVLEICEDERCLLVRTGVGWGANIVGHVRLPMGEKSSESYSIEQGKPVITEDIGREDRFEFPAFMKEQGVVAIANAPIFLPGGRAYGLLQVDSREVRDFTEADTEFLRTYTTILGPVIDRLIKVHDLQVALDNNNHLLNELQHRIKNHIGTIRSIINMRAREADSQAARDELVAVGERVETLRLLHEQLYTAHTAERLNLRPYIEQLTANLLHLHESQSGRVQSNIEMDDIDLAPEYVVPLGLIINEFTVNSLKYAFDQQGGVITFKAELLEQGGVRIQISDSGKGLPAEPRPAKSGSGSGSGTGMGLIEGLARQIQAQSHWSSSASGTMLRLEFKPR